WPGSGWARPMRAVSPTSRAFSNTAVTSSVTMGSFIASFFLGVPAGAEGDGVAQLFGGRDAMLPAPADFVAQHIRRARLEIEREDFRAFFVRVLPEPHPARAGERHA